MENNEIIFNASKDLFEISKTMNNIDKNISQMILCMSDMVLQLVEEKEVNPDIVYIEPNKKMLTECDKEYCPDCGGIKEDPSIETFGQNDPTQFCHGHNADGMGTINNTDVKPEIGEDVKSLIEKIKKELD